MKISKRLLLIVALILAEGPLQAGELLSRISEDSEALAQAPVAAADAQGKLIYRVICSPDDAEPSPDCEKPPLEDAFNPVQLDQVPQMPEESQTPAMQVASVSKPEADLLNQAQVAEPPVVKHAHPKKKPKAKKHKKK